MMKKAKLGGRTAIAGVSTFAVVAALMASTASAEPAGRGGAHSLPEGYDNYMVYIANGLFDPQTPSPDPNVTNCDPLTNLCDGYYFQRYIIGRTDAEIAAREEAAKMYFRDKFGVDVDDPANEGRIMFKMFQMDPRMHLRLRSAAGQDVPSEGWQIRDGGFLAIVIDPNGFVVNGELGGGQNVPPGTFITFSEYSIKRTAPRWRRGWWQPEPDPIVLHVQSNHAMVPGSAGFQCELHHPDYGWGLVQGHGVALTQPEGRKFNIVGVLTFPGLGNVEAAE